MLLRVTDEAKSAMKSSFRETRCLIQDISLFSILTER